MIDRNFTFSVQKLNLTDGSSVDQYKYQMSFKNGAAASISFPLFLLFCIFSTYFLIGGKYIWRFLVQLHPSSLPTKH